MPNYQQGKIYKITSGEQTYIGSTCEPTLARRLSGHVYQYKYWKQGKIIRPTTSLLLIESGNYEITLVELYPCRSKDELTARERHWIETTPCVNKNIPGRTHKEYMDTNRDIQLEKKKINYKNNKEDYSAKAKNYYEINKQKLKDKSMEYYNANKDKINQQLRDKRKIKLEIN
jgi:hypothetical protein